MAEPEHSEHSENPKRADLHEEGWRPELLGEAGGGTGGEKGTPYREEELPADPLKTKKIHFDQVRAIAMAPHSKLGSLGWAAVTGVIGSLPGAVRNVHVALTRSPPTIDLWDTVNLLLCVFFVGLGVFAVINQRGHTSEELLYELFPNAKPERAPSMIFRMRRWGKYICNEFTRPL